MKILVVNPNSSEPMTRNIGIAAQEAAAVGTEVITRSPSKAPASIESFAEDAIAGYRMIEEVLSYEGDFDGVVVACYYDPAVQALRELVPVPVIGIAEASMHMGALLAPSFSIVTVLQRGRHHVYDVVQTVGLSEKCASIRTVELGVLDIDDDFDVSADAIEAEARHALQKDGAEAILLGCAGMGPLSRVLHARLQVPVIDGVGCAVSLVEACVNNGLSTSKLTTWAVPPNKTTAGKDALLEAVYKGREVANSVSV